MLQEAVRKDIERAFGVLQARFHIVKNPCRQWSSDTMSDIMTCCIILHNMILEDERGIIGTDNEFDVPDGPASSQMWQTPTAFKVFHCKTIIYICISDDYLLLQGSSP